MQRMPEGRLQPGAAPGTFLDGLDPGSVRALRSLAARRVFRPGAVLALQDGYPSLALILLEGYARLSIATRHGREITLAIRGPGELIGEISAGAGPTATAQATALTPGEGLTITMPELRRFLLEHPEAAIHLLGIMGRRLRESELRRVEFATTDTGARVARLLAELAERYGSPGPDGITLTLPLSQADLAGWTGSSREAVNRALASFRARGWLTTLRRGIIIGDLDSLRRLAG